MSEISALISGYFENGVPFNRAGNGRHILFVLQGLTFENKPLPAWLNWLYSFYYHYLGNDYTIYVLLRRRNMPPGYTIKDMAADYAGIIREKSAGPVDVIGVSTGGSIAQQLSADHPGLVRKLVIQSGAYTLSGHARLLQKRLGQFARKGQWHAAYKALFESSFSRSGAAGMLSAIIVWPLSVIFGMAGASKDPNDLVVTVEAEDGFNFQERLGEIKAPTLVVAGDRDSFIPVDLVKETAKGIPDSQCIVYKGKGHPVSGRQLRKDIRHFLIDGETVSKNGP
jgi:pimeloyl-ACP methyl ester carboxylesterase